MEVKNPCLACAHYEFCGGTDVCNSFVHKLDELYDKRDADQTEDDYIEYRAAYISYLNEND